MNVLLEAVYDKFDNDPPLKAAVTDLYANAAPQDTAFPYLVMTIVSNLHPQTFTSNMEDVLMQFSIFSEDTSSVEIGNIFELLKAVFDDAVLNVAGYDDIRMRREASNLLREPDDAWHYVVDYSILIQKQ